MIEGNQSMSGVAMTSSKSVEQRLAAAAKKASRDQDAVLALREYAAEKARVDANTLRLRELRLAKEAADAVAKAAEPTKKKPVRARVRKSDANAEANSRLFKI